MKRTLIVALLAGCATVAQYDANMQTWLGKPEADLIRQWGAPDAAYETAGAKFLTYNKVQHSFSPGTPPSYQTSVIFGRVVTTPVGGSPASASTSECKTTFEISAGVIAGYKFAGNACRARQ